MPVYKFPTLLRRITKLRVAGVEDVSPYLPVTLEVNAAERLWFNILSILPEFIECGYSEIVAINGSAENMGSLNWTAGTTGGSFNFDYGGLFKFYPGSDFDLLEPGQTQETKIRFTASCDGTSFEYEITVTVAAYIEPVDAFWSDVSFMYQYPLGEYDLLDRTGNYATAKIGTISWISDTKSPYSNVFAFGSSTSQLAVGASNDFNFLAAGEDDWTFDGWFMPSTYNSQYIIGMTSLFSAGNGFSLFYNYSAQTITAQLHKTSSNIINGTFSDAGPINTWKHWAFQFDAFNATLSFYRDGVLRGTLTAFDSFNPAGVAGQLYLGGRFTTPSQTFRGRMASVRLTKAQRWPEAESFTMPLSPFPVG